LWPVGLSDRLLVQLIVADDPGKARAPICCLTPLAPARVLHRRWHHETQGNPPRLSQLRQVRPISLLGSPKTTAATYIQGMPEASSFRKDRYFTENCSWGQTRLTEYLHVDGGILISKAGYEYPIWIGGKLRADIDYS